MKKIQWLFVSVLLTGQILRAGNNPIPAPVVVSKVTFSGGIKVKNDNDSEMPTTQWVDEVNNGDPNNLWPDGQPDKNDPNTKPNEVKSFAYAYTSESEPTVGAVFKWKGEPPEEGKPYSAEGEVIDTPNCKVKLKLWPLDEETSTIYPDTKSLQKIVHERRIQAYLTANRKVVRDAGGVDKAAETKPLIIKWTVRNVKGVVVGESYSSHTIYVTWVQPSTELRQETLFNASCVRANGMRILDNTGETAENIFEAIWAEFEDRKVRNMTDETMLYWGTIAIKDANNEDVTKGPYSVNYLLTNNDGACNAWARFLVETGRIHRLAVKQANLEMGKLTLSPGGGYPTKLYDPHRFLIKEWSIGDNAEPVRTEYTPGQDNDKPRDSFTWDGHVACVFSDLIYDPSYGKSFPDPVSWVRGSVSIVEYEIDEANKKYLPISLLENPNLMPFVMTIIEN